MDGLCLLWRGGFARANRPDGLIGNHEILQQGHGVVCRQQRIELGSNHGLGSPFLPFTQGLAHAQDGGEPCGMRAAAFGENPRIRVTKQGAPLGMSHQHEAHPKITQHLGRDFAGIGAGRELANILDAKRDRAIAHSLTHGRQMQKWRTHCGLDACKLGRRRPHARR